MGQVLPCEESIRDEPFFLNVSRGDRSQRDVMLRTSIFRIFAISLSLAALPVEAQDKIGGTDDTFPPPEFLPAEQRGAGFRAGETFQYHGGWGIFSSSGLITVTTELDQTGEADVFHIVSHASTHGIIRALYPANTRSDTFVSTDDWTLLSSHVEGKTGKDQVKSTVLVDYENKQIQYQNEIKPEESYTQDLRYTPVLDYMSAIFQIRGLPLEVGRKYSVLAQGGGDFYLVNVEVTGTQTIKTALGKVACFTLKPSMNVPTGVFARGGGATIWLTQDEHRLMVRADINIGFGTARLRLDSYEVGGVVLGKKRK